MVESEGLKRLKFHTGLNEEELLENMEEFLIENDSFEVVVKRMETLVEGDNALNLVQKAINGGMFYGGGKFNTDCPYFVESEDRLWSIKNDYEKLAYYADYLWEADDDIELRDFITYCRG